MHSSLPNSLLALSPAGTALPDAPEQALREEARDGAHSTNPHFMNPMRELKLGYGIIALFFGLLLTWGVLAQLSSAAIAPGEVYVEGHRKQVQHLYGGTVKDILVREGDQVHKGQTLILLEDLDAKADYATIRSQLILAMARRARLQSASQGQDRITFPAWLLKQKHVEDVAEALQAQQNIFRSNHELLSEQKQILQHQIAQGEDQIRGEQQRLRGLKEKARLNARQLQTYKKLLAEGLITRSKLYTVENELAGLKASIGEVEASLAANRQNISQLKARITELDKSRQQGISRELDTLNEQVITLKQELSAARSRLQNTQVRAPIDGVVVNQTVHTTGGVVAAGETLLEIVPSEGKLMIEARIDPKDRDTVTVGQTAEVRFSAFNQRTSRPVQGEVSLISADRLTDSDNGQPYYRAVITLKDDPEKVLNGAQIHPGMQAEVMIVTGERSALDYLTAPFARSLNRAFRED